MTKDEKAQLVMAQRYLKSAVDYFSDGRVAKGVACIENVDVLIEVLMTLKERKESLRASKSKK